MKHMSDDQRRMFSALGVFFVAVLAAVGAGTLAAVCVAWDSQRVPEDCREKVAVPGWDCDEGAQIEVVDGVAICRCPVANGQP